MKRILVTGVIAVSQLVLAGVAVGPQLSARLTGDTYLLEVAPLDPIDPFRGAYVALDYPGLQNPDGERGEVGTDGSEGGVPGPSGDVFITLAEQDGTWVATDWSRDRPEDGPYLACDDRSWQVRCGIESLFLPQDTARETEDLLRDGAVAEVRIDGRGNAAVVDVRAP
jgi:uncharacterized membrane-anchored protein